MSSSRITFRELFDSLNRELKQAQVGNRSVIPDSARAAQKKDVIDWTNQSLNTLSIKNPLFWRRTQKVDPIINGNRYEFPLYWSQIESISVDGQTYLIGPYNDANTEFYTVSDNELISRNGLFNGEIYLTGTFRPIKLGYLDDTETSEDMNQVVDLDERWIELLILMLVCRYAARERENYTQAYAAKEQLLLDFQKAFPQVVTSSEQGNQILFGNMGNIH